VKHVKFHLNRFLRRVRIHDGEFDTSARAMYREGVTSSLRADLRIVRGSTIERKQMSTKTTFKRVALVTVAALGFGVMSVVPSSAAINQDSLTLSSPTASQTTRETQTATSAVATVSFLAAAGESMSVTTSLVSGPAGNTALPWLSLTETASAGVDTLTAESIVTGYKVASNTAVKVAARASSAVTTAKFAVYLSTDSVTAPTKAGTYVVKLTPATVGSSGAINATAVTLTITVTAAAADDTVATSATSIITAGETTTSTVNGAAPTIDDVVTASSTIPTTGSLGAATIKVSLKNASALAAVESFTATISGAGTLGAGDGTLTSGLIAGPNATGRALTVRNGDFVQVFPDGTSGVGTVTITSAAGLVLATETITFFGAATTITASVVSTVLNVGANADALNVVIKDAAGVAVSNATIYVTSETATTVSGAYTTGLATYDPTTGSYDIALTGVAAGKTKITVGTKSSATATTGINATAVEVRVGSTTAASVKVALDKASYAPGEKATITVSLFDKDGLANADGTYASIFATGGITSDFVLGAGSDTTTATSVHWATAGVIKYTVYMPIVTGDITFTYKTAGTAVTGAAPTALSGLLVANQAVTTTMKATVSNPAVDAAAAAAEEATAAANDATDAALSAAEAAEAATAMAQEAVDAVAELSASVTKLISALRAQITTLTNLVVKIQKKVKA
jgi:trimeric autotransporter adhesin